MKNKLFLISLLGIAIMWGCGPGKQGSQQQGGGAPKPQVISLPGLIMKSMRQNPLDSTNGNWNQLMTTMKTEDSLVRSSSGITYDTMAVCCPCLGQCCPCNKLKMMIAPVPVPVVKVVSVTDETSMTELAPQDLGNFKTFSVDSLANGNYYLNVKADSSASPIKCYFNVLNGTVTLIPHP